jgi:hypothetical protein
VRRRIPSPGLAQGLHDGKLPQYLDLLVSDGPRAQEEAEFCGALHHGINEALGGHGIHCAGISETVGNQGYRFLLKDRDGKQLWATVSFDEMIELGETHGERGMFDRVLGLVIQRCKETLTERDNSTAAVVDRAVAEYANGTA